MVYRSHSWGRCSLGLHDRSTSTQTFCTFGTKKRIPLTTVLWISPKISFVTRWVNIITLLVGGRLVSITCCCVCPCQISSVRSLDCRQYAVLVTDTVKTRGLSCINHSSLGSIWDLINEMAWVLWGSIFGHKLTKIQCIRLGNPKPLHERRYFLF
jgi:hypothetical protein